MTHSDAPFAHPLSPNVLLGNVVRIQADLKFYMTQREKNVRKERNINYAYVGDRYRSAFYSHVLFF